MRCVRLSVGVNVVFVYECASCLRWVRCIFSCASLLLPTWYDRDVHYLLNKRERERAEHKLNFQPKFLFPVISSFGFFNDDMKQLMKLMVNRFKDTQEDEPERDDGIGQAQIKGRYKIFLKNTICFALVKGLALATYCQGVKGVLHPT